MPNQSITVKIKEDGSTAIDFGGFVGSTCLTADEDLRTKLALLGIVVAETSFEAKLELQLETLTETLPQQQRQTQTQGA